LAAARQQKNGPQDFVPEIAASKSYFHFPASLPARAPEERLPIGRY
jgi:hypothetical protein